METTKPVYTYDSIKSMEKVNTAVSTKKKIKIALLLDTSNSMDGLIDQAKSQLWKFVNALSGAHFDEEKPDLELALYEYGNSGLSSRNGYIRLVSDFTEDLDLVSEKLFSLSTNGGEEYCGQVISTSLNELDWKGDDKDLRIIFIAGNEEFTQGPVNYKSACGLANEKGVVVNTIFCGDYETGINLFWKSGAMMCNGNYMNIDQNQKTVYIESPYDAEIALLNDRLNATYLYYGIEGNAKRENQLTQDLNSRHYGRSNLSERAISKTSSFYKNSSWDLIDASKEKSFELSKIKREDLPVELRDMDLSQRQKYIEMKDQERQLIKEKILDLSRKRQQFITSNQGKENFKYLDATMLKAIKEQAERKGFVFK